MLDSLSRRPVSDRRSYLAAAVVGAAALVVALPAAAKGPVTRIQDAAGDAVGGAADITTLEVWSEDDGTLVFALAFADRAELTTDDYAFVLVDSDMDGATGLQVGSLGLDHAVYGRGSSESGLLSYEGDSFHEILSPSLRRNGNTFSVDRSELGTGKQMLVVGLSQLVSNTEAFDATALGLLFIVVSPKVVGASLAVQPAAPKAGTTVTARATVRLDDGEQAVPTTVTCRARLAGRALRPAGAPCRWRLPKTARGKRLVVTATGSYGGTAFTAKPVTVRVR